jgi:hypothetical protein
VALTDPRLGAWLRAPYRDEADMAKQLLTAEEIDAAAKMAVSYRPPGS